MIEPISQKTIVPYHENEGLVACHVSCKSTIASKEEGGCISFLSWVFSPIMNALDAIFYRVSPSLKEYELFEEILEGSFQGAAFYLYDQKVGEEQVREVLAKCEELYTKLCDKWFPNIEGILFMRVALLKVKLRILAALGEEKKVLECEEILNELGVVVGEDVKFQAQLLSLLKKRPYRYFISAENSVVKVLVYFMKKMRGRRDSNSQLLP